MAWYADVHPRDEFRQQEIFTIEMVRFRFTSNKLATVRRRNVPTKTTVLITLDCIVFSWV